jgi:hypothetical protein
MADSVNIYIGNLQNKPSYPIINLHHWTDYLELLCLANIDGELSKADYIQRFAPRENDLREGNIEDMEAMDELEKEGSFTSTNRSQKADKWTVRLDDWFLLLEHRAKLYGDYYPFKVEIDSLVLKDIPFSKHQLLYCYLLFCSNLYLFDDADRGALANSFELLSVDVLKNLLPANAHVHLFGKNPLNVGDFVGPLWDKIHLLAEKLNEQVNSIMKKERYPPTNTGDDGLDVVGWVPSGDSLPSKLIYFGQCTCNVTDWSSKQNDSAFNAWSNKISLTNYTNNIIFIPFCFRDASGQWINVGDISKSLLIDRRRLLYYLYEDFETFEKLPSYGLFENIVIAKEEVF